MAFGIPALVISVLAVVAVVACRLRSIIVLGVLRVYSTVWSLAGSHNLAIGARSIPEGP